MTANDLSQELANARAEFLGDGDNALNKAKIIAQEALIATVRKGERTLVLAGPSLPSAHTEFVAWLQQAGLTVSLTNGLYEVEFAL